MIRALKSGVAADRCWLKLQYSKWNQLPRSKLAWFVTALRLSSGGAGFGIITRYDWRVDDRPADIDRRDVVCRSGEPSDATEKVFMAIALYSPYKH